MGSLIDTEGYSKKDFTSDWYVDIGSKVCIFIFMSSFLKNVSGILLYVVLGCRRIIDRGCKSDLKNDPEDPEDDLPNTKQKIQADLEKIYTGKMFEGEKTYSRMMSTLFVILMYCSGMPILYFIGAVFYTVTYLVNKYLLINFYKKSTTLTRTIP